MNGVEPGGGFPGLVRLQVADQVPAERRGGRPVHFLEAFLDFVLAEVDLPGLGGGQDVFRIEGLGNGDEADGGRVAPHPAGGARDAIAYVRQPGTKRGGIEHYFFSCATSPLAVAALGPSGASFK